MHDFQECAKREQDLQYVYLSRINCKIESICKKKHPKKPLIVDECLQEIVFFIKILLLKVNITCFLVTEYCRDKF